MNKEEFNKAKQKEIDVVNNNTEKEIDRINEMESEGLDPMLATLMKLRTAAAGLAMVNVVKSRDNPNG